MSCEERAKADRFVVFVNLTYYPYVAYDGEDEQKARTQFSTEKENVKHIPSARVYFCKVIEVASMS